MANANDTKSFIFFSLFWVGLVFLALVLAMLGFFYREILALYFLTGIGFLINYIAKNRKNIRLKKDFLIIVAIALFSVIVFSYFTTPSVFNGRDQGSFSNAAIALSQNHNLEYSFPAQLEFFKIYGPGTALNFPGFNYTESGNLITHFPLAYTAWLAIFYSFFGLLGFVIANAVTFFIFLLAFFLIAKKCFDTQKALFSVILVISTFVFYWFFKFTLSENLALALVWFGIFLFWEFIENRQKFYLFSAIFTFVMFAFTRIEGFALLIVIAIILAVWKKRENFPLKTIFDKKTILFAIGLGFVFLLNLKINSPFYVSAAKGFLSSVGLYGEGKTSGSSFFPDILYLLRVFSIYALLTYIILGLLGIIFLFKNGKYKILLPFFILAPTFIYLILPSITQDHPWMLRRYVFSIIPVLLLYSVIFLDSITKKKIYFYSALLFILAANLIVSFFYLPLRENTNLLSQIKELGSNFKKNDLVLIDRNASGDPYSMISGPLNLLFEKQAVYFFNPEDIKKINISKFENIYLIAPDNQIEFYEKFEIGKKLIPVKDYEIETIMLENNKNTKSELQKYQVSLPALQKNYVYGKIYKISP